MEEVSITKLSDFTDIYLQCPVELNNNWKGFSILLRGNVPLDTPILLQSLRTISVSFFGRVTFKPTRERGTERRGSFGELVSSDFSGSSLARRTSRKR